MSLPEVAAERADLPRALGFTLFALLAWRLGAHIPIPGIATDAMHESLLTSHSVGLSFVRLGNPVERLSMLALGLLPYISAWIIVELWTILHGGVGAVARQSAVEHDKNTRRLALVFAAVQGYMVATGIEHVPRLVVEPGLMFRLGAMASLMAGCAVMIWLADLISWRGITNGFWLLIAASFVLDGPRAALGLFELTRHGAVPQPATAMLIASLVATVGVLVLVERAAYPLRVVTRGGMPAGTLPIRINLHGVLPVPFAYSLALLPLHFALLWDGQLYLWLVAFFQIGQLGYFMLYGALIIGLTLFYNAIAADPAGMASRIDAQGQLVPGVAAGTATETHIRHVLRRLAFLCGVYLCLIALGPELVSQLMALPLQLGGLGMVVVGLTALDIVARYGLIDSWLASGELADTETRD